MMALVTMRSMVRMMVAGSLWVCMVSDVLCAGSQCSYISYVRYSVGMHEGVWKRVDRPGEPANRYIYRTYIAWATN